MSTQNKLLVILGPTASGKTDLSIKLAKKYNGEVVSADSRQIYCEMDIGTAKPPKDAPSNDRTYVVNGIIHHLLDIKNPNQPYTVAEYKEDALKAINKIIEKNKLPILCGGTGLYVKAIVENLEIPKVEADVKLRNRIEKEIKEKGLGFVFKKLVKLDPEAAYIVDPKNPRRVIRALEITMLTKKPFSQQRKTGAPLFNFLEIGISAPNETLIRRINQRADKMIKKGLVKEVENLVAKYGNQQAFDAIGYREIIEFLNGKISLDQAVKDIKSNTWHFAKRQMTWFKPDKKIIWVKKYSQASKAVSKFLKIKRAK